MKHQFINANKIIEAIIIEPYETDVDCPLGDLPSHGWQVVLIMGYAAENGYPIQIKLDYESEQMCLNACNEFGLRFVF